jgi:hypothetical protein
MLTKKMSIKTQNSDDPEKREQWRRVIVSGSNEWLPNTRLL